jgi:hypothetical protein
MESKIIAVIEPAAVLFGAYLFLNWRGFLDFPIDLLIGGILAGIILVVAYSFPPFKRN